MKATITNVLFIGAEQVNYTNKQGQPAVLYKAKLVDDKGDFGTIEINVENDKIASLPPLRSRVDVECDVTQRNYKTNVNNPVFKVLAETAKA